MKHAITFFVFVCVSVMFGYNVRNFILSTRNPYIYTGAFARPSTIHAGDPLRLVYIFDHIRVCSTKLGRFIENEDTDEIVYRDEIIGGATSLGVEQAPVLKIMTDKSWIPGNYIVRLSVNAQCVDNEYQYYAPEIKFKIIANEP